MTHGETFLHTPSGTKSTVVVVCADRVWALDDAAARIVDHGIGGLRSAMGDPDSDTVLVTVEDVGYVLRAIDLRADTITELCRSSLPLHVIGRSKRRLIVAEEHPGEPVGSSLLEISDAADVRPSTLTRLSRIDEFSDGVAVGSWGVVHPSHQRLYRGGGAGRLLQGDAADLCELELSVANAADICAVGDRIFFLDDVDGTCQVFSVGRDTSGPIQQVTRFSGAGATSLRRGGGGLVVGRTGEAWLLDPTSSTLTRVASPRVAQVPDIGSAGAIIERVRCSPDSNARALIGEGILDVDRAELAPGIEGFVLDSGWGAPDRLLVLAWTHDGLRLTEHRGRSTREISLPSADDAHVEGMETAGSTVVLFGEEYGVWTRFAGGPWTGRCSSSIARRGKPAMSRDGRLVAWVETPHASASALHVVDLAAEREGRLLVRGAALRAPSFVDDNTLVFASQSLDPWTAAVSPVRDADCVCEVSPNDVIDHGSDAPVRVRGRGLPGTQATVVIDGAVWAAAGSRAVLVDDAGGAARIDGRFVGDDRTPAFLAASGVMMIGASGTYHVAVERTTPSASVSVGEALRYVRASGDEDALARAVRTLHSLDAECGDLAAARATIRACVRELGLSHAAMTDPPAEPDSAAALTRSIAERLRLRAAQVLEPSAEYLALSDVGPHALRAVESLARRWSGSRPLVVDLRSNAGGPFADHIAALLHTLIDRALTYVSPRRVDPTLSAPAYLNLIIDETTGSGGEQLAAILSAHSRVLVVGRRSVGAGTGFHAVRRVAGGVLTIPQYRIVGTSRREQIENHGVHADVSRRFRHTVGEHSDDALLVALPADPGQRPTRVRTPPHSARR